MTLEERFAFFENYDLIHSGVYGRGASHEVSLGSSCRFCGDTPEKTTFKNVSHAIPECLGNHQLIAKDECDRCNEIFSKTIEDHLDKYTKPFRIMGQIKGKRKVPNYRSSDHRSRIEFTEQMTISFKDPDTFVKVNEANKTIEISTHREPYVPHEVFRGLIKVALSTLDSPTEFAPFAATARWLTKPEADPIVRPAPLMYTFIPGPRPTNGVASIFMRRKAGRNDVPYGIYVIAFGNISLQVLVPSTIDAGTKKDFSIPFFPTPFELDPWPYGPTKHGWTDMVSKEVVRNEAIPMTYSFDSLTEIDPPER